MVGGGIKRHRPRAFVESVVNEQVALCAGQAVIHVGKNLRRRTRAGPDAELIHLAGEIRAGGDGIDEVPAPDGVVQIEAGFKRREALTGGGTGGRHAVQEAVEPLRHLVVTEHDVIPGAEGNRAHAHRRQWIDGHFDLAGSQHFDLAVEPVLRRSGVRLAAFIEEDAGGGGVEPEFDCHCFIAESADQIGRDDVVADAIEIQRRAGAGHGGDEGLIHAIARADVVGGDEAVVISRAGGESVNGGQQRGGIRAAARAVGGAEAAVAGGGSPFVVSRGGNAVGIDRAGEGGVGGTHVGGGERNRQRQINGRAGRDPGRAILQLAGQAVAAGVADGGAGTFIKTKVQNEVGFDAGELTPETGLDLRPGARRVPNAELVDHAGERQAVPPDIQIKISLSERSHAGLLRLEHAVAINPHEVSALAGDEREVLPGTDDGLRRRVGEAATTGEVAEIPIDHAVRIRNVRVDQVVDAGGIDGERRLLGQRGNFLPKLDRDFGRRCGRAEIGHEHPVVHSVERHRRARSGLGGGEGQVLTQGRAGIVRGHEAIMIGRGRRQPADEHGDRSGIGAVARAGRRGSAAIGGGEAVLKIARSRLAQRNQGSVQRRKRLAHRLGRTGQYGSGRSNGNRRTHPRDAVGERAGESVGRGIARRQTGTFIQPVVGDEAALVTDEPAVSVCLNLRSGPRRVPDADFVQQPVELGTGAKARPGGQTECVIKSERAVEFVGHLAIAGREAGWHAIQKTIHLQTGLVVAEGRVVPDSECGVADVHRGQIPDAHDHVAVGEDFHLAVVPAGQIPLAALIQNDPGPVRVEPQFHRHCLARKIGAQICGQQKIIYAVKTQRGARGRLGGENLIPAGADAAGDVGGDDAEVVGGERGQAGEQVGEGDSVAAGADVDRGRDTAVIGRQPVLEINGGGRGVRVDGGVERGVGVAHGRRRLGHGGEQIHWCGGGNPGRAVVQTAGVAVGAGIIGDGADAFVETVIDEQVAFGAAELAVHVGQNFGGGAGRTPDAKFIHLPAEGRTAAQRIDVVRETDPVIERVDRKIRGQQPASRVGAGGGGLDTVQKTVERFRGVIVADHGVVPGTEGDRAETHGREMPDGHLHFAAGEHFDLAVEPVLRRRGRQLPALIEDHARAIGLEPDFRRHRPARERGVEIGRENEIVDAIKADGVDRAGQQADKRLVGPITRAAVVGGDDAAVIEHFCRYAGDGGVDGDGAGAVAGAGHGGGVAVVGRGSPLKIIGAGLAGGIHRGIQRRDVGGEARGGQGHKLGRPDRRGGGHPHGAALQHAGNCGQRGITRRGAAAFIAAVIEHQARLIADQPAVHVGLNLIGAERGVPDAKFVERAGKTKRVAADLQIIGPPDERGASHLCRFLHAVAEDAHVVSALARDEREMLP